jgi:RNA polymerase sigma-70 factor (ECF subfamily)
VQQTPGVGDSIAATPDLLARYRDGDRGAFQAIVGEYQHRLLQFFYRLCWDRDRAEDLTQELFMKLLRGAHGYEPRGRLSTFVFRVATNLWIDHYRAAKPRGHLYSLDQVMLHREPIPEPTDERPEDPLVRAEERAQLRRAMSCLTEPHRLVLELAVYQEMPYAQISETLEIPVGTVKSRMHKCVQALRERLADPGSRQHDGAARPREAGGA